MRRVVMVESPYSGLGTKAIRYLACCLLDSILRGEAPISSHGQYPLALPEHAEAYDGRTGREIGLECRDALAALCVRVYDGNRRIVEPSPIQIALYADLGVSEEMRRARQFDVRFLQGEARRIWESGRWPSSARCSSTNEPRGSERSRTVSPGLNSRCICQLFRVHLGSPETVDDVALRELVNHEPPLVTIGELSRPRLTEDGLRAVAALISAWEDVT